MQENSTGPGMSSVYGVRWLTSSHICMPARYLGHYSRNSPCVLCCHPSLKSGVSWMKTSQLSLVVIVWAEEQQTITDIINKNKKPLWRHDLLNKWYKTSLRYMFPNSPSLFPFDILEFTPVYWLERGMAAGLPNTILQPLWVRSLRRSVAETPYRVNAYQNKQ